MEHSGRFQVGHPSMHTLSGNVKIAAAHKNVPETDIARAHHRHIKKNNTSGRHWVHKRKDNGKYRTSYTINNIRYNVGTFNDVESAYTACETAYKNKMLELGLQEYLDL